MEIISSKTHINFVQNRKIAYVISGLMILASLLSMMILGLNPGIDFSGGTLVQVRFSVPPPLKEIRHALNGMNMGDVVIQEFGAREEILIRIEKQMDGDQKQSQLAENVINALKPVAGSATVELRRVEFVGPQVGEELTSKGVMAMLYSMIAILVYVAWRFELRFSLGAVLALVHDVIITLGFFSLLQMEFTLVVVAALLTLVGYSLNDTIVVYDRIREEMKRMKKQPLSVVINEAINQTLSRTIITSGTVLLVLVALLLFGGEVIHDFSITLFFGIVVGTYSSIFVASPIVLAFEKIKKSDTPKVQTEKEKT